MNKTTAVSRRNALVMAGTGAAGLALASCGSGSTGNSAAKITGQYTPYGIDPNAAVPSNFPPFAPKFITLVRISAGKPWGLAINHASFPVGAATTRAAREKLAAAIFKDIAPDLQPHKRLKDADPHKYKHHKRANGAFKNATDVVSFAEFGANQQTEIYVWFDHFDDQNPASKKDDVQVNSAYLVSFTQLTSDGMPAKPNDSFIAREAKLANLAGPFIAIEDYYSSFNASTSKYEVDPPQTTGTAKLYSMNLAYSVPDADAQQPGALKRIPLLIDPDTGHGVGYEP